MKKYNIALSLVSITLLITLTITLSLTSCVKDDLYNTPYPDRGCLLVTTDWSGKSEEATRPDTYTIQVGAEARQVTGESNLFEPLLLPGSYELLVYNTPEGITVSGTTASVGKVASGILPMPGYLFASLQQITVHADDTLNVTAPMRQYVRRIDLELAVKEGNFARVASASATLSGVASTLNIATAERGSASSATNQLQNSADKFSTSFRLLGIAPASANTLTVEVLFTNGDRQTIVSDLSELLQDFNASVLPLKLTGELFLPVEGGVSGYISGWEQANAGNIDAH